MSNRNVRLALVAAIASTLLPAPLASQNESANPDSPAVKQQGHIRVFNLAHVSKGRLFQAEAEVNRIFAQANIEMHWAEGALDDSASLLADFSANNSSPSGCRVASHAREMRVQLLPRAPVGIAAGTLGFSLPCAKFGIDSTIFIHQCEAVTLWTSASFSNVLAYAIAHELGHILLRSGEHSETGLMRAHWDKYAWLRAAEGSLLIDREQARRMRIELLRMESLAQTASSR